MTQSVTLLVTDHRDGRQGHAVDCALAAPRFPANYAKSAALRKAADMDRSHTISLGSKKGQVGADVEATLHEVDEVDLNCDGVCDLVVTVRDPVSSGGDQ